MERTLDTWVPRLRDGVRVQTLTDGSALARRGTRIIRVVRGLVPLLARLDGRSSLAELVKVRYQSAGRLDFVGPITLIQTMHSAGMLADVPDWVWQGLFSQGTRRRRSWLARMQELDLMLPLRGDASGPRAGPSRAFSVTLVLASLALLIVSVFVVRPSLLSQGVHPLSAGKRYDLGAIQFVLAVIGTLSFRGALRAVYFYVAGLPPVAFGLRLRFGVPFLDVPRRMGQILSRELTSGLAFTGLGAIALASGVLFLLSGGEGGEPWRDAGFTALLLLLLDACPFALTDLAVLFESKLKIARLRRRTYRFLTYRLLRNITRRERESAVEMRYLLVATGWILYATGVLVLLVPFIGDDLLGLMQFLVSALLGTARAADPLGVLLGLFVVAYLGALTVLGVAVLVGTVAALPLALIFGRRRGPRPERKAVEGADLVRAREALTSMPFLEHVDPEVRDRVASHFVKERFRQGARVVTQGTQGRTFYLLVEGNVVVEHEEESGLHRPVARLHPGQFFGEVALLRDVPRTATVRAVDDVTVFALSRDDFDELLKGAGGAEDETRKRLEAVLMAQRMPIFSELGPSGIQSVVAGASFERHPAGDMIIHQGAAADALFLLLTGKCRVVHEEGASQSAVADLEAGDYFGEIGVLHAGVRTSNVDATSDVELMRIPAETFLEAVRAHFRFGLFVDLEAAERIHDLGEVEGGATWDD